MTDARSFIVKGCGYVLIAAMLYLSLCPGIYLVSAVLLVQGIVLQPTLLRDFQRDFYFDRGLRTIWQTQKDCVQPDERLIYVPRIGSCRFTNAEFDTSLHFDIEGRLRNSMSEKLSEAGIALLGDSYAMGWGVNDSETFANVLQDELKRPVYNLAVSSYGTMRELLRLEQSGLIDQVDTILIQYAANDVGENAAWMTRRSFVRPRHCTGKCSIQGAVRTTTAGLNRSGAQSPFPLRSRFGIFETCSFPGTGAINSDLITKAYFQC